MRRPNTVQVPRRPNIHHLDSKACAAGCEFASLLPLISSSAVLFFGVRRTAALVHLVLRAGSRGPRFKPHLLLR